MWGEKGLFLYLPQYFIPLWWQEGARSPALAALLPGSHDSMLLLFKLLGRMGIISNEAHVLRTCNYIPLGYNLCLILLCKVINIVKDYLYLSA